MGGASLVVGVVCCEPVLDLAMFSHRENGSVHLDSSPEGKVTCSKSDASEDVGFDAHCVVNFINELCLEHSCLIFEEVYFVQATDGVVGCSIIVLGRKVQNG